MRFIFVLIVICLSCNTNQTANRQKESFAGTSAVSDHEQQITATFLSVQQMEKKFQIMAIVENETGITSFSKGDTISLYPNFVRNEGESGMDLKNDANEHMNSLQKLASGSRFNALVKIQGKGKKRYGLIMTWEK